MPWRRNGAKRTDCSRRERRYRSSTPPRPAGARRRKWKCAGWRRRSWRRRRGWRRREGSEKPSLRSCMRHARASAAWGRRAPQHARPAPSRARSVRTAWSASGASGRGRRQRRALTSKRSGRGCRLHVVTCRYAEALGARLQVAPHGRGATAVGARHAHRRAVTPGCYTRLLRSAVVPGCYTRGCCTLLLRGCTAACGCPFRQHTSPHRSRPHHPRRHLPY